MKIKEKIHEHNVYMYVTSSHTNPKKLGRHEKGTTSKSIRFYVY